MHAQPHTKEAKNRIAEGQRARHAERRRDADYRACRTAIMALESAPGDFADPLILLYVAAERLATHPVDRSRWTKRIHIASHNRRVRTLTAPAEVFAGRDLIDLERLRAATTPADLVGPEGEES